MNFVSVGLNVLGSAINVIITLYKIGADWGVYPVNAPHELKKNTLFSVQNVIKIIRFYYTNLKIHTNVQLWK